MARQIQFGQKSPFLEKGGKTERQATKWNCFVFPLEIPNRKETQFPWPVIDGTMSQCRHLAGRADDLQQKVCFFVCWGTIRWEENGVWGVGEERRTDDFSLGPSSLSLYSLWKRTDGPSRFEKAPCFLLNSISNRRFQERPPTAPMVPTERKNKCQTHVHWAMRSSWKKKKRKKTSIL